MHSPTNADIPNSYSYCRRLSWLPPNPNPSIALQTNVSTIQITSHQTKDKIKRNASLDRITPQDIEEARRHNQMRKTRRHEIDKGFGTALALHTHAPNIINAKFPRRGNGSTLADDSTVYHPSTLIQAAHLGKNHGRLDLLQHPLQEVSRVHQLERHVCSSRLQSPRQYFR